MTGALQKLAELIGIDEVRKYGTSSNGIVLRARLGGRWVAETIDISALEDTKNATMFICDVLFRMAERLKAAVLIDRTANKVMDALFVEGATGTDLDKIVESYQDPARETGETDAEYRARFFGGNQQGEDTPQHSNRFEAIVAELLST